MCFLVILSLSLEETFIFLRYAMGLSVLKCHLSVLSQAVLVAVSL